MLKSRTIRWQAALAVGLSALGIGASSASAAPAQFNSTQNHVVQPVGTVTFSWGAGGPTQIRQCAPPSGGVIMPRNSAGQGSLIDFPWNPTCTDGNGVSRPVAVKLNTPLLGQKNSGVFSLSSTGALNVRDNTATPKFTSLATPVPFSVAWQNPVGVTSARFTFTNTYVANVLDNVTGTVEQLRVTGTFQVSGNPYFALV